MITFVSCVTTLVIIFILRRILKGRGYFSESKCPPMAAQLESRPAPSVPYSISPETGMSKGPQTDRPRIFPLIVAACAMCSILSSRLYWDPAKDDIQVTYTDEGIKIASRSALANVFTKLFGSGDDINRLTHLTGPARARALKQIQRELNQLDDAARAARLAQLPLVERFLIDGNFAHNFYSLLVRLRHNPRDTEALEILGKLGFDKKTLPELQAAIRRHSSGIYSDKEFLDALRFDTGLESQGVPFDVWSGVDNAWLYDEFGRMFKPGASELMSRPPVKFSFDGYSGPKKVYIFEDAPDIVWAPRQLTDHFFKTDQDLSHMIMQDPVILGPGRSKDLLGEMLNNYYGAHTVSPEGLAALEAQGAVVRLKGSPPKQYSGFRDLELEAGRPSPTGQAPDPAQKYEYFDLDGPEFTPVEAAAPSAHLSPDTSLLGRADLTADDIRGASDAALESLVNSFRPRAAAQSPPALNTAETFAIMEQRHRFLKANNEKAAEELERTFRLPPRDHAAPANGQPNINGGNSPEKITITPEEAGVTNGGEIPIR